MSRLPRLVAVVAAVVAVGALTVPVAVPALVADAPAVPVRSTAAPSGEITVSAASSLTEAFTRLGSDYEQRNRRARVRFNFGSSSTLGTQIQAGAPADVFAAADHRTMERLVKGGEVTTASKPFARNRMQIAVRPGNPKAVDAVADLATVGTIALCGSTVPCGRYAARILARADVTVPETHVTRGADAKATLAAVSQGDANAAIVYATDVITAGRAVTSVEIPAEQNVVARYRIAPVADAANPRLARAFVAYVRSAAGRKTLARFGFLAR